MIINTIKQTGIILQSDDNRLCPQYSENLQMRVIYDDTYNGWSVKWDAIGCKQKKRIPLEYDVDSQCIILNKDCFIDEYLYLACAFVKDGMVVNTEPIELHVPQSINHNLDTLPKYPGLYDEMNELFKQIFSNEYKRPLDELFEKNEVLQDNITKTEEVVNNTLSAVNEAIEQSSSAAQNANTATSAASDAAQAASSAANRANDAASDASSAAQSASNIASEVERKLQAGEFIGETGPIGPVGPKGEDGATGLTGPKGDPGSRILYGSGAPSSSVGNIGDWYYDTGSELWDVYYKSGVNTWTKIGQIKSDVSSEFQKRSVSNENLLINGDFQVWQRGTTVDAGKRSGFAPDRWYMSRNESVRLKTTVKSIDGLCVTFTSPAVSGDNIQFDYLMPTGGFRKIAGRTVTLSYDGTNTTGDIKVRVRVKNGDNFTEVVPKTEATSITFKSPKCNDNDMLDIVVYVQNTATVHYVKLEPGGVATTNVPRYYSEELMECMRFYQRLTYSYSAHCSTLNSSLQDTLFLKMPMRTTPTITSLTSIPNNDSINVRSINYSYLPGGTLRFSVEASATGFVRVYNVTIELESELI